MNDKLILIRSDSGQWWKEMLKSLIPDVKSVVFGEDEYDEGDIAYAVVWNPPLGMFDGLNNLKCVASIGAGVSHILKDRNYPRHVPIIRCVGAPLQYKMAQYVALHVLRIHRRLRDFCTSHEEKKWKQFKIPLGSEFRVGVMGLGNLGSAAAKALVALGYDVSGWSRRGRPVEGVTVYKGLAEFDQFLRKLDVLVAILPQTQATENILDKSAFELLPEGAFLINAGRGENIVDDDLLEALESGKLAGATLDVFREEPLPSNHPFWAHPSILVTSHTAAAIDPLIGGQIIANSLKTFIATGDAPNIVDLEQGY